MPLPPISGYYGNLGAGKSGYVVHTIHKAKLRQAYMPVCSTVPIALPGNGTFFLAGNIGDYIAAGLVFSRFAWSDDAKRLKKVRGNRLHDWTLKRAGVSADEVADIFGRLHDEYRTVASNIDWRDKKSIDSWMIAHNYSVLNNCLGKPMGDVRSVADQFRGKDFYKLTDQINNEFRFVYRPPHMKFALVLDEVGVAASSDDNTALKNSAFYPWLAQLRKFGGVIAYSGHDPSRVFKQMREVTDAFFKLVTFDVRPLKGAVYIALGFKNEMAYEMGKGVRRFSVDWVSDDTRSRYSTYWMVMQPEGLQAYAKELAA